MPQGLQEARAFRKGRLRRRLAVRQHRNQEESRRKAVRQDRPGLFVMQPRNRNEQHPVQPNGQTPPIFRRPPRNQKRMPHGRHPADKARHMAPVRSLQWAATLEPPLGKCWRLP